MKWTITDSGCAISLCVLKAVSRQRREKFQVQLIHSGNQDETCWTMLVENKNDRPPVQVRLLFKSGLCMQVCVRAGRMSLDRQSLFVKRPLYHGEGGLIMLRADVDLTGMLSK